MKEFVHSLEVNSSPFHEFYDIRNDIGNSIRAEIRYPHSKGNHPILLICHSFMAFKDWGFFPYIARQFSGNGFATLTFNFSKNGVVGDGNRITDFAAFASNTFTQELHDLERIITALQSGEIGRNIDFNRLVLLGHSRGGGIALLAASRDQRVRGLITWAAISTFDRWTPHQKEQWRARGYLPLAKDSMVSPLRMGANILEDIELHHDDYDLRKAASRLQVPWLLLHGKADVTVSPREAEMLFAHAPKNSTELAIVEHAGHLFNAASPTGDRYQILQSIIDTTTHWLKKHFTEDHP